jgi:DNA repair protein RadA/Sms
MKPPKVVFVCQECGSQAPKWAGRCAECGAWNSLVEERGVDTVAGAGAGAATHRYGLMGAGTAAKLYD